MKKSTSGLEQGSSVDGYKGFAIGRSIFWHSLKGWHEEEKSREEAVTEIADSYLSFISVYQNGS
jgi:5-dehydro-2-deoxygluconokinase